MPYKQRAELQHRPKFCVRVLRASDKASMSCFSLRSPSCSQQSFAIYLTALSHSPVTRGSIAEKLSLRSIKDLYTLVPNAAGIRITSSFRYTLQINLIYLLLIGTEDSVDQSVSTSQKSRAGWDLLSFACSLLNA